MSPVFGVLLCLTEGFLGKDFNGDLSQVPVIRFFASLPGVSPGAFEFFLGADYDFSQSVYAIQTSVEHVKSIFREIVKLMKEEEVRKSTDTATVEDDDLCPICYADKISTRFEPCQHRFAIYCVPRSFPTSQLKIFFLFICSSCNLCITRHLLNESDCFFCKTKITSLVKIATGEVTKVNPKAEKGGDSRRR